MRTKNCRNPPAALSTYLFSTDLQTRIFSCIYNTKFFYFLCSFQPISVFVFIFIIYTFFTMSHPELLDLEQKNKDLCPESATCWLCDFGNLLNLSEPYFPLCKKPTAELGIWFVSCTPGCSGALMTCPRVTRAVLSPLLHVGFGLFSLGNRLLLLKQKSKNHWARWSTKCLKSQNSMISQNNPSWNGHTSPHQMLKIRRSIQILLLCQHTK